MAQRPFDGQRVPEVFAKLLADSFSVTPTVISFFMSLYVARLRVLFDC